MKTNPEKTICDKADALWNTFLLSKCGKDRLAYIDHVENCHKDFINKKYPWTPKARKIEASMRLQPVYTKDEIKEIENKLHEIGINCTSDSADCGCCNHDIECSTVFLKFDEARKVNARRTRNDD